MAHQNTSQQNRPTTGIAIIVFGLFMFSFQDVIIKAFSDQYSVLQIVFIRCMVALVPTAIAVFWITGWRGFVAHQPRLLLLRGLFGFLSYLRLLHGDCGTATGRSRHHRVFGAYFHHRVVGGIAQGKGRDQAMGSDRGGIPRSAGCGRA